MPQKQEKQKQVDTGSDSALKRALSKVSNVATSPILPERPGLSEDSIFKKSIGFDVPMFGGSAHVGIPSMSEMYDNLRDYTSPIALAAMGMMAPRGNLQSVGRDVQQFERQPSMPVSQLPPDLVPVGSEAAFNAPRPSPPMGGMTQQAIYNLARDKFNMGRDMPTATPPFWTNYRGAR